MNTGHIICYIAHLNPNHAQLFTHSWHTYAISLLAQVGINTNEPQSTLDVNGTVRVSNLHKDQSEYKAIDIVGVDENGNFILLELDENLFIEDNTIKSLPTFNRTGTSDPIINTQNHNLNLVIWPGGTNAGKKVMRLAAPAGNIIITGIDVSGAGTPADADGKTLFLTAVDGDVQLRSEDANSLQQNQFLLADGVALNIRQYETIQIMYDSTVGAGTPGRWLVISRN